MWLFRLAAVAGGLSVGVAAEVICIWCGWGNSADFDVPFVGFAETQALFVTDTTGERYEITSGRSRFFRPESFPAVKGSHEFRIFVLGGSTVAGEPYATATAFTTWLELALQAADPERDWNVVNCGGISYASYRLVPIVRECLGYQPDLLIVSLGHNEFLEDRTYGRQKQAGPVLATAQRLAVRLRTVTLVRAGLAKLRRLNDPPAAKPALPAEVDALLDHAGALAEYHRDTAWHDAVVEDFGRSVRGMVRLANAANVPLILMREPSNLADCPPFKSQPRDGLSESDQAAWRRLLDEARARYRVDRSGACQLLCEAVALDDQHALGWYELGKCREAAFDNALAREAFVRARDLDVCPLRMITPLEESLREVAAETGTTLLDAHALLESRTTTGILGNDFLVDHVHPSFTGHQLIAEMLFDEMFRRKLVAPPDDSDERRRELFDRHFAELPPLYFERGRQTLERLRGWAAGRAEGRPLERAGRNGAVQALPAR
ncbi:MAG: GDSL-type esterase/lipase family protein [Planctomycetaceae bacterium]